MSSRLIEKAQVLLSQEKKVLPLQQPLSSKDRGGKLSIALAYPNRYYTAMSNLGFQAVYWLFNQEPDTLCQRVFLPDPEDLHEYHRTRTPLFSLESQWPVRSFDVLAFSLPYENDDLHLLQMLELAQIPLLKKDRSEADPLVMAGGASMMMNPEPLVDFVDFFVIGEAERVIGPLTRTLQKARGKRKRNESLWKELAAIEGIYVPILYTVTYKPDGPLEAFTPQGDVSPRVKRAWVQDLNQSLTLSPLVTERTELSNMLLLELSRGCRRRCRFCASGYIYFPYRNREASLLRQILQKIPPTGGKIGLVGAAISDYPDLVPLGREILHGQKTPSFSSLRVDTLSPELADLVRESGQKTVTLAPEAGSERMRRVIRKGFTEEDIFQAVEILASRGMTTLRLYFMVGLPTEQMEDVKAIVDLTKRIRHHLRKQSPQGKRSMKLTLSLNSFVPKPATPFQWHPFEEIRSLNHKIQLVKKGLGREKGVSVTADLPKWAYLQSLLSRGDRRVGKLLLAAHQFGGNWPQAYRSVDVNPDFYVYRRRTVEEILPWDFIDHGIEKGFLWEEYQEALKEGGSPE